MWRLYGGVNFLATGLSRMALAMEQLEMDECSVQPHIVGMYLMVDEARKLLPLFEGFAEGLVTAHAVPDDPCGVRHMNNSVMSSPPEARPAAHGRGPLPLQGAVSLERATTQ